MLGFVVSFFKDYFQGLGFLDWFMVYGPKLCIIHKINDIYFHFVFKSRLLRVLPQTNK